jgi:hypothetical protein
VFSGSLRAKDAPIAERSIGIHIVDAYIALLGVVHVKVFPIGGKGEPVRLCQIFGEKAHFALFVEAVDALEGKLLLFSFYQVESRVREVDRSIRTDGDVVGAVEFLPLEAIRENCVLAVRSDGDDCAENASAVNEPALAVIGVTVGIAERNELLFAAVRIHLENLVLLFIADVQKAPFVPDRPFCESESGRDAIKVSVAIQQFPESGRFGPQ